MNPPSGAGTRAATGAVDTIDFKGQYGFDTRAANAFDPATVFSSIDEGGRYRQNEISYRNLDLVVQSPVIYASAAVDITPSGHRTQ